jgi:histidyl-tRNA synthetase
MDKPTIPKGTRDFGPAQMAKRQFIFDNIRRVFQKYGFQPLETPAMEKLETLTGKYGEEGDQLLFKILNNGDFLAEVDNSKLETRNSKLLISDISGKGLRYDLTVPFARYVVMNRGEITFPFKRYQIQPVWRADRPQKGRYREFYQCDADVVGTDSLICEAEIVLMIKEVFKSLGINDFTIKINHRAILSGLAELTGSENACLPVGRESSLFVAIDKLDKIGEEKVKEELRLRGFEDKGIDSVFAILNFKGSTQQKIDFLKSKFSNSEKGKKGITDFEEVLSLLESYGAGEQNVEFDISLARGLSYYTGCIFEVKINNVAIGSVSGGGRYDNLTGVFGLPDVSGVGISFGVDRLYDAMEELKIFPKEAQVSSKVMIAHFDDATLRYALSVANQLRESGISTEIYPDVTKLKKQLEYANKKEIPYVIVVGSDEMKDGMLTLKDMEKGEQEKLNLKDIGLKLAVGS